MSKRCELQKEYYQANGNYKGKGKYSDDYVSWLEEQILDLRAFIESLPQDKFCKVCNLPTDGEKCYSKRCPI